MFEYLYPFGMDSGMMQIIRWHNIYYNEKFVFYIEIEGEVYVYGDLPYYQEGNRHNNRRDGWHTTSFNNLQHVREDFVDAKEISELEFVLFTGHSIEASFERDKAAGYLDR